MRYYIVDAFTDQVFGGNPAGVCLVDDTIDSALMQKIAMENNLSETAFVKENGSDFDLRWFTPEAEVDLCGHATLASAFVVSEFVKPNMTAIRFHTKSGLLTVEKKDNLLEMDFPARKPVKTEVTSLMEEAIGVPVLEAHQSRDLLLLVEDERSVQRAVPHEALLKKIPDSLGIIVTAKGSAADFVSRFFAPSVGVLEDPVTGSAHSTLIPFWSERLNKTEMTAKQISVRGGLLHCQDCGDRVKIAGSAALYLTGEIHF